MPKLMNYTTEVEAEKSVGEIISCLRQHKVSSVLTDYDGSGKTQAISFTVHTAYGELPFRLPANVEAVHTVLTRQNLPYRLSNKAQAERVAWRILASWVKAQMALLETEQVALEQIFLPYLEDHQGATLYERMLESKFNGYKALPAPATQ